MPTSLYKMRIPRFRCNLYNHSVFLWDCFFSGKVMAPLQTCRLAVISVLLICGRIAEACTEDELVMVQMLVRHGATSPVMIYPEDPNPESVWTEGMDDLTMIGKFQPYALGNFLRYRYSKHINFITSDPNELTVKSAAHRDCVKSALSFTAALYEPTLNWEIVQNFAWQPLFVEYEKEEEDEYFSSPKCPVLDPEYSKELKKQTTSVFNTYEDLINYWQMKCGWELQNIADIELLYNILETEALHNLTIPKWALNTWDELKSIHDISFAAKLKTKLQQRLRGGPLVGLLLEGLKKKAAGELDKTKVMVYSTHGFNMAAFLSVMGMWNYYRPLPCATVLAELYNHENDFYVRYLYLNSSIPDRQPQIFYLLQVPGCTEFCPLSQVIDYTKDLIPNDWEEECQIS